MFHHVACAIRLAVWVCIFSMARFKSICFDDTRVVSTYPHIHVRCVSDRIGFVYLLAADHFSVRIAESNRLAARLPHKTSFKPAVHVTIEVRRSLCSIGIYHINRFHSSIPAVCVWTYISTAGQIQTFDAVYAHDTQLSSRLAVTV